MKEIESVNGLVKIFAETIEEEAINQIIKMADSPIGENANIRIMPDCHVGKGCTIGTTMKITDKICPNIVGVDIGCGVTLIQTNIDFKNRLEELDGVIRKFIPCGMTVHQEEKLEESFFGQLKCWSNLSTKVQKTALRSLGTLGGGNHFIETYDNGWIAVHSGSRNIGLNVANYYQSVAEKNCPLGAVEDYALKMMQVIPQDRQAWTKANKPANIEKDLMYLTGSDKEDYLHDINIIQTFARMNRSEMLRTINNNMDGGHIYTEICSTHNYIDTSEFILRKGAISARTGEKLVIPLNMRDGMLVCQGKGNLDWNYSAPHGAGRLYSRTKAKEKFTVEEYQKSMEGIYTTCINGSTLDEAPFAYKDCEEIKRLIEPTVKILEVLHPIYNFKAN